MCPAGIDRRRSCATLFEDMCNEFRRVYIAASRIFRKPLRPFWMIVGSCWETDYETIKLYNVNKHMLYKCRVDTRSSDVSNAIFTISGRQS